MKPLKLTISGVNKKVSKKDITKWLRENGTYFQGMLHRIDMVAVVENISSLTIAFSEVPIDGGSFVILKNPDKFPNIYCPETEADCCFSMIWITQIYI